MLAALALAGCATDYVPDDGWDRTGTAWEPGEQARFYERWYGNQLAAMDEPSFRHPDSLGGFARRYRLTVLPTFTQGFAARVDEATDGSAMLQWVILDGAGGYDPGDIAGRGSSALTPEQVVRLDSVLDAAMLASVPMDDRRGGIREEDGETVMTICLDGTTWLFELAGPDGAVFVTRSCVPEEDGLVALINETYALLPPEPFADVED